MHWNKLGRRPSSTQYPSRESSCQLHTRCWENEWKRLDTVIRFYSNFWVSILMPESSQLASDHTLYLSFLLHRQDFRKPNFTPKKTTKITKNTKNVSEKVIYMHFFHSFWKNLHLTEIFTQTCLWCLWQIWGMCTPRQRSTKFKIHQKKSVLLTESWQMVE